MECQNLKVKFTNKKKYGEYFSVLIKFLELYSAKLVDPMQNRPKQTMTVLSGTGLQKRLV